MQPATIVGPAVRFLTSESTGAKIPTIAARGMVFSAWQPSPEEIEQLEAGATLWLVQRGSYIPEMSMIVGRQEDIIPRDMQIEALEDVSPDRQRMIEDLIERKRQIEEKVDWPTIIAGVCFALSCGAVAGVVLRRLCGW